MASNGFGPQNELPGHRTRRTMSALSVCPARRSIEADTPDGHGPPFIGGPSVRGVRPDPGHSSYGSPVAGPCVHHPSFAWGWFAPIHQSARARANKFFERGGGGSGAARRRPGIHPARVCAGP